MPRRFLFLQGPTSPYAAEVGRGLRALGHEVHRIDLCLGDRLFWREPGATAYRGRFGDWPGFVAGFLAEHAITDLVLLGEQRPYHRPAIAAARPLGVAVTVTDFGYLRPDWLVVERDGMNGESRFPRDPAEILRRAADLPPLDTRVLHQDSFRRRALWDMAYHLSNLLPWPFPHYRRATLHHPLLVYPGMGWRLLRQRGEARRSAAGFAQAAARGPVFLFAMQMENDYSIRAYSPYPDMDTPIAEAMRSFAAHAPPEAQLAVKLHPLDPGLKNWPRRIRRMAEAAGIAGRVAFLGAGALEPMLAAARGLVTVNSTAALQALTLGRPVLALGQAIYRIPGLAFEGPPGEFWRGAPPPDPALAEAFLRLLGAALHVRGTYYARPGLDAAVAATVHRLHHGLVNDPGD
ncbi:capsular biosynthesis protein [Roseococcus sp. SYP-B2431]|uniref:capsule biosynthesis protein n=1 Tax=Roseococcus sp. SYP-B2431 TaxID=2496640 RepID=UPI0010408326|nr:capsular biosynthesis protein [Roseococcus sp. SYP-B2431]TCH96482.1 capsular biosynthesis protein [Roseococcus sp. SYP-B2431]